MSWPCNFLVGESTSEQTILEGWIRTQKSRRWVSCGRGPNENSLPHKKGTQGSVAGVSFLQRNCPRIVVCEVSFVLSCLDIGPTFVRVPLDATRVVGGTTELPATHVGDLRPVRRGRIHSCPRALSVASLSFTVYYVPSGAVNAAERRQA